MKKTIIGMILAGLLFSGNAFAEIPDHCQSLAKISEAIMTARQNNMPMIQVVEVLKSTEFPEAISSAILSLISIAYKSPRYSTERMQKNAITDFQNKVFNSCISE